MEMGRWKKKEKKVKHQLTPYGNNSTLPCPENFVMIPAGPFILGKGSRKKEKMSENLKLRPEFKNSFESQRDV